MLIDVILGLFVNKVCFQFRVLSSYQYLALWVISLHSLNYVYHLLFSTAIKHEIYKQCVNMIFQILLKVVQECAGLYVPYRNMLTNVIDDFPPKDKSCRFTDQGGEDSVL